VALSIDVDDSREERNVWRAIGNGLRLRCPKCGQGKLFRSYLKVADECPVCGEHFHHHRADDLPAYLSIVVVGHVIVGLLMHFEMSGTVSPWIYLATLLPLTLILTLAILPSIKGGVVGLQWANRMHGFDPDQRDPALPDDQR
jgi:uncharacterized protein (DUF983 family)